MIEVARGLYVGNQLDYERQVKGPKGQPKAGWAVLHCAKEPYHREMVGYGGHSCPRGHDEYLVCERDRRMALNMIDVEDPKYFAEEMVDRGLYFIREHLTGGNKVLVHCNQGGSRGPSMALLYLRKFSADFADLSFAAAVETFTAMYPNYMPAAGVKGYLREHWED